jgi:DNA polymerase-3 subunit delta'
VSNAVGALLDTIVSRCQVIPFAPLPVGLAAGIIRKQRPELDETGSLALAALADGCPGQALTIEADGLLALYGRILEALLAGHGKAPERIERALALAADLADAKEGVGPLLALLRIFLKNTMAARTGTTVYACTPEVERARERWNLQQLSDKMAAIDLAEQALARNCNRGLTSEVLLLDLFDCSTPMA